MFNTRQIGSKAEDQAANFLKKKGYKILGRNFTIRGGEIDLVTRDGENLVFVEVKMRFGNRYGSAAESITPWKIRALQKTALFYIQKNNWGFKPYRFDLVTIDHDGFSDEPKVELVKDIIN